MTISTSKCLMYLAPNLFKQILPPSLDSLKKYLSILYDQNVFLKSIMYYFQKISAKIRHVRAGMLKNKIK